MKIVINKCYGGFSISQKAAEFMAKRGNEKARKELHESCFTKKGEPIKNPEAWFGYGYTEGDEKPYDRSDPDLVAAVEVLGKEANGRSAELKVVEIPDGVQWEIEEYDGMEWVAEQHRTWH